VRHDVSTGRLASVTASRCIRSTPRLAHGAESTERSGRTASVLLAKGSTFDPATPTLYHENFNIAKSVSSVDTLFSAQTMSPSRSVITRSSRSVSTSLMGNYELNPPGRS
jgi:hypothetical protein